MRLTHRSRGVVASIAMGAWLVSSALNSSGGDKPPVREQAPKDVHLVGDEDAASLRRIRDVLDDFDPRMLRDPYVETVQVANPAKQVRAVRSLRRSDLSSFIADVDAARALGKAFFWEMQAGSDFRRRKDPKTGNVVYLGNACASCHYRNGADARNSNTTRIPYVAWEKYDRDPAHPLEFGEVPRKFEIEESALATIVRAGELYLPRPRERPPARRTGLRARAEDEDDEVDGVEDAPRTPFSLIVGSQGVAPRVFKQLTRGNIPTPGDGDWDSEESAPRKLNAPKSYLHKPEWSMFLGRQEDGRTLFRQVTIRNAPTVANAGFSDRLFHDGRAESTFNGFSIFGDVDKREILHIRNESGDLVPIRVAISKAALASQAVGPVVNEVEMSYQGRSFHDLAAKLLDAPVLGYQAIADDDSQLAWYKAEHLVGPCSTYRALIRRAFRREWWDGSGPDATEILVPLRLSVVPPGTPPPKGSLMEANFSLYWGLSLLLYQSGLVSNESPFDAMMRGNGGPMESLWCEKKGGLATVMIDRRRTKHPEPDGTPPFEFQSGAEVYQRGLRVFINRGCIECHSGPLLSEVYQRAENSEAGPPIDFALSRTLLPNAQGDAIALRLDERYNLVLGEIVGLLTTTNPRPVRDPRRLVRELERLREEAGGSRSALAGLLKDRLSVAWLVPKTDADRELLKQTAGKIAELWMDFEKKAPTYSGSRTFFTEDERVDQANLIAGPVQVERMSIPANQVVNRRPLPIEGPLAKFPYAFYDVGFYHLGLAPPRYDRGVGDTSHIESEAPDTPTSIEEAADHIAGRIEEGNYPLARSIKAKIGEKMTKVQIADSIKTGDLARREDLTPAERRSVAIGKRQPTAPPAVSPQKGAHHSVTGRSGSAYRFDPDWKKIRPKPTAAEAELEKTVVPADRVPGADDKSVHGPNFDLDAGERKADERDYSWFRDFFAPGESRRAEANFRSRARTLVQDESPTGRRKPFLHDNELAFWGAFKTPSLRNVDLTPPYMHNGRLLTLIDVLDFYDRGGDLQADPKFNPDKHPAIVDLDMSEEDKFAVVFFLMSLTDDRVRYERGPFDHPSLIVVNGYLDLATERTFAIDPVGASGSKGDLPTFPAGR